MHNSYVTYIDTKKKNLNLGELVKSQSLDGTVKSSSCKARKSYYPLTVDRCPSTNHALTVNGKQRTVNYLHSYAAVTKDAAQRSKWTFYEAVNLGPKHPRQGKQLEYL